MDRRFGRHHSVYRRDGDSGEATLRCIDCDEVQVVRIADSNTLHTSRGRVRLFGADIPELGTHSALEAA